MSESILRLRCRDLEGRCENYLLYLGNKSIESDPIDLFSGTLLPNAFG